MIPRLVCVSGATAAILQANLIPVAALLHYGTEEQRKTQVPDVADGSVLMSIAVTEPDQGGHSGGTTAAAAWDGRAWVLTGVKAHVGNSNIADLRVEGQQLKDRRVVHSGARFPASIAVPGKVA